MIPCLDQRKADGHEAEKHDFVVLDQPGCIPPPSFAPLAGRTPTGPLESLPCAGRRGGRRSFAVHKRSWPRRPVTLRRPRISAPTNFQHISTGSLQFPSTHRSGDRPPYFRPLELDISVVNNRLSIPPRFEQDPQRSITPPQPAHRRASFDSDSSTLSDYDTSSSCSFHIPRRPIPQRSISCIDSGDGSPSIPQRSRLRTLSSPERVESIVERIASAMLEVEMLQSEMEALMVQQRRYMERRSSTAHGVDNIAPMPSIPATPAAAPSFAQRLSLDQPQTGTQKAAVTGVPAGNAPPSFDFPQLSQSQPRLKSPPIVELIERPMPPPLPLVLRPPLRKKKSLKYISNWFFGGGSERQDDRQMSLDSVTNTPMPVTEKDGFYTYVTPRSDRDSIATSSSASSWSVGEDIQSDGMTMSPAINCAIVSSKQDAATTPRTSRMMTFGRLSINAGQPRPQGVGVAY